MFEPNALKELFIAAFTLNGKICTHGVNEILIELQELEETFSNLHLSMYSSSLLFVIAPKSDAFKVKLIDLAHVFKTESFDKGIITGIRNLIDMLLELSGDDSAKILKGKRKFNKVGGHHENFFMEPTEPNMIHKITKK